MIPLSIVVFFADDYNSEGLDISKCVAKVEPFHNDERSNEKVAAPQPLDVPHHPALRLGRDAWIDQDVQRRRSSTHPASGPHGAP